MWALSFPRGGGKALMRVYPSKLHKSNTTSTPDKDGQTTRHERLTLAAPLSVARHGLF